MFGGYITGMRANIIRKLLEIEPPVVQLNFKFKDQLQMKKEGGHDHGHPHNISADTSNYHHSSFENQKQFKTEPVCYIVHTIP